MAHVGGSGRYVEGERVFAPPAGVFDADWVAGIVCERLGQGAPDRVELAGAAQLAWSARRRGEDPSGALAGHPLSGPVVTAVLRALDDWVDAGGSAPV
ncbi:hypothetical protein [Kineococcus sp. NUM-3379]